MKPSTVTGGVKRCAGKCARTCVSLHMRLEGNLLQSPLKTACLPACTWVHLSVTGKSNNAAQLSPWLFFADGKNLSQFHTIKKKAELHSNIHSHRQNYLSANKRVSVHCEITFWQRLHVSVCTSYWCIPKGCVCQQPNFL